MLYDSLRYVIRQGLRREEGQTMAEYGVMLALITLAVVGALGFLAVAINGKLGDITTTLGGVLP